MKKILGITGGSIGADPMGFQTWSGSSRRFFLSCINEGVVDDVLGVRVSRIYKYYNAIVNFSLNRSKWRKLFYSNISYRDKLTYELKKILKNYKYNDSYILQVGAEFNAHLAANAKVECMSYNDGNYILSSLSPFFPNNISEYQKNSVIKYETNVCNSMVRIFTMSEYLKRSFVNHYNIDENKVKCIGAGINFDRFPDSSYVKDYSNCEIVFIGVEFERKGGLYLLEAFKHVKDKIPYAKLNIIGPDKFQKQFLQEGVIFHGKLNKNNNEDMVKFHNIMNRSSLFVMPSLYEPFGIAPLEAMSYRTPCVVTDEWALPEIVLKERCGELVPIKNSGVLGDAIVRMVKDPDLLQKYGEYGRRHVLEKFTWDSVAKRLKKHLEDM